MSRAVCEIGAEEVVGGAALKKFSIGPEPEGDGV